MHNSYRQPGSGDRNRRGFLRPDDSADKIRTGPLVLEERQTEQPTTSGEPFVTYNNPYASLSIQSQRSRLPIFRYRNPILYMCEKYRTIVIVGETGCGKSTQVPQYLLEAGWANDGRMIVVTEPRRVAVVTLATRVADEKQITLGHDVGYTVRFDDVSDAETKLKYVTDGILLREFMVDPLLSKFSVVMVDEAHERSYNTDILLGLLRKIMTVRSDLRVIISSATLDAELFRDFFELNESSNREKDTAAIISVEGRTHPVVIYHTKTSVPNYIQAASECVLDIHKKEHPGDILVFLSGQDEVEEVCEKLRDGSIGLQNCDRLWIVPCYGALPAREQMKAFDSTPHGTRKVVVATNIAEASVTIPGIAYIVDSGYVKIRALNREHGVESLMRIPISQASAEQRAGRAGRIRPGKAYRLYPLTQFEKLQEGTVPEIQRCHLAPVILQLKALGINNIHKFHYLSRPPSWSVIGALDLLYALGALDEDGRLTTPTGYYMVEFPLTPMHCKCLLEAAEHGCSEEMLSIVAMMQIQDVFIIPFRQRQRAEIMKRRFSAEEGDHLTYLNVYTMFVESGKSKKWCEDHFVNYRGLLRAENVRLQLSRLLKRFQIPIKSIRGEIGSTKTLQKCLVRGFFSQAAYYDHTGKYVTVREGFSFNVYKGSVVMYRKDYPKWVIFSEVMQDSIRDISAIDMNWLHELAPHYYEYGTDNEIATKRRRGQE